MSLYKREDSKYFWIKLTVKGQKPILESTRTANLQQAKEYYAKRLNEIWEQSRLGIKPKYLWEDAVVRYIEETSHNKSHSTDQTFFRWLHTYLAGKYLNDINRALLDRITSIRKKEGNVSNGTVNRYMQVVSRVLRRAALDWEWIDKPVKIRSLPEPKIRIRFLTSEEAARLINELPPHLEAMVRFSLATGLRKSNVTKLMWSQVNLQDRRAWIHADQAKG
jgi:integrase